MFKNTYISLKPDSQERMDALNTLKYTLLLKYDLPNVNTSNNDFIDMLMKSCRQCCNYLFHEDHSPKNYVPPEDNFFGRSISDLDNEKIKSESVKNNNHILSASYFSGIFPDTILEHCVLSSYHAILTDLLHEETTSAYCIANTIKNDGFNTLIAKKLLIFGKDSIRFSVRQGKSSVASDFYKLTSSHLHVLPEFICTQTAETQKQTTAAYQYNLQFASLCHKICRIPAPAYNGINLCSNRSVNQKEKHISDKSPDAILERAEYLANQLEPYTINRRKKVSQIIPVLPTKDADYLYQYYLTERLFNLNLFYSLLKYIKITEDGNIYRFESDEVINILICCKDLPNIFSRKYFLKYAFDQFQKKPNSYSDFWSSQSVENHGIMGRYITLPKAFQYTKWLEQYKLFFKYMSSFLIPVYEWCFINLLLESIEREFPTVSHSEHLRTALNILTGYMNKNYDQLLTPIQLASKEEDKLVNMAAAHENYEELTNVSGKSIKNIAKAFFDSDNELELNLHPLNPAFFQVSAHTHGAPPQVLIRKTYIGIVRDLYCTD